LYGVYNSFGITITIGEDFFKQRPWTGDLNLGDGLIGEGISHDFDRTRYFTSCNFTRVVSRLVSRPIPLEPEYLVESGLTVVLAELTGDVLGNYRITITAGMPDWSMTVNGEKGIIYTDHVTASMQSIDDEEAVSLDIPESDRVPEGADVHPNTWMDGADVHPNTWMDIQPNTWNRLISDFVSAVRKGDKDHTSFPDLATLEDGTRAQEVVAAGRLSEKERRWVEIDELD